MVLAQRRLIVSLILGAITFAPSFANSVEPAKDRGLYAIWYNNIPQVLDLPYVSGGQVVVQWSDVEPSEGQYDFSKIEEKLKPLNERGYPATIQINGNIKPEWLFDVVPSRPEIIGHQIKDKRGTLMYWHERHEAAYLGMLRAFARFLKETPLRDSVLGVRLNFNSLGTEHFNVEAKYRSLSGWNAPAGVEMGAEWTKAIGNAYRSRVVEAFVEYFTPEVRVFVRNSIDVDMREKYLDQFEKGALCWFHTSTEAQPRGTAVERQYQTFLDYCRTGKTLGYAECWASAWGDHGGKRDERPFSPPQWNYWRLLADLNSGVSFIAAYGTDLRVAVDGVYKYGGKPGIDALAYKDEFTAAFEFAAKYAGYHASPKQSPGAWIAFREGDYLKGDYSFLMSRGTDLSSERRNVGPDEQRYGAWARLLPANDSIRLTLDEDFANSLRGKPTTVRVTYLRDTTSSSRFTFNGSGVKHPVAIGNQKDWTTWSKVIPSTDFQPDETGAHIRLDGHGQGAVLHMVEITRGDGKQ